MQATTRKKKKGAVALSASSEGKGKRMVCVYRSWTEEGGGEREGNSISSATTVEFLFDILNGQGKKG